MDQLIQFDQQLLLTLNGSDSVWLDNFFLIVTRTSTWMPLLLLFLFVLLKNRPWREALFVAIGLGLVILICDQFASSLCKPLFHRFRPSHEPALEGLVDLVEGRRGGLYGFFSSHAANTFGVFAYLSLYLRRRYATIGLFLWASLSSYSRIYLGFHYPGDILVGMLFGLLVGALVYQLLCFICARWLSPLHPFWPVAPTLLGYNSNPMGIECKDSILILLGVIFTAAIAAALGAF